MSVPPDQTLNHRGLAHCYVAECSNPLHLVYSKPRRFIPLDGLSPHSPLAQPVPSLGAQNKICTQSPSAARSDRSQGQLQYKRAYQSSEGLQAMYRIPAPQKKIFRVSPSSAPHASCRSSCLMKKLRCLLYDIPYNQCCQILRSSSFGSRRSECVLFKMNRQHRRRTFSRLQVSFKCLSNSISNALSTHQYISDTSTTSPHQNRPSFRSRSSVTFLCVA